MRYSKMVSRKRKKELNEIEVKLEHFENLCASDPREENITALESVKLKYEQLYEHITKGLIVQSRVQWHEKGEKNHDKYFLNLMKRNKSKSSFRKIYKSDRHLTCQPKEILKELSNFYSDLFRAKHSVHFDRSTREFLSSVNIPKLSDEKRNTCEGKLTVNECYNILSTFKNKTLGNDGLTIEFYKAFWSLLGNQLVDALNYSYEHGQLFTSQRQAVITLLEKKKTKISDL